ncbi:diguanylate cyclase domain-containing protein [Pseudoduganella chitinolytica]|uniref:Diguanylate cyclase n=1 Tax=Pseudoduganella chitinolytica TaxID=34070 RepID=A0ABY8BFN1_9BURK|nr:diguanylate cyclase [Pseudoduganella chitinolytica]WEF33808.1 diguanylate cyclase [Pseudoduganella chitinolytica]
MWTAVLYQLRQERASAWEEGVLHAHEQARTLAENVTFLLRQADHAAQLFQVKFEETGGALRLAEFTRPNGALASLVPPRLEMPVALYGRDGHLADSLHGTFDGNVAAQPFFRALAAGAGDTVRFDTPSAGPAWHIRIARRLNDAGGRFAGVIVLLADPNWFIDDYDRVQTAPGGLVLLQSAASGVATARVDERLYGAVPLRFNAGAQVEEAVLRTPLDGVARLYARRALPRYGLQAVVGHTLDSAMARARRQGYLYLGAVTAASLLVLGFTTLLTQQNRRLARSMQAANEAQRQLRAAVDASLDALFLLKAHRSGGAIDDFLLADVNERGAAMMGHPRAELLGHPMGELVPAWRSEGFIDKYRAVLATGQPLEEEFETRTGEPRWLHHQIVAIDDGVAVTLRDITPVRRSVMALRENEARLRTIADNMPAMIAYVDRDEIYRFHNRSYGQEFARRGIEAIGRPAREVLGERRYAELLPHIRRAQAGEAVRFEEDDGERSFEVMYIPQPDEDGRRVIGFHVVRNDVTAQKTEQRRLVKLAQVDPLTGLANRAGFQHRLQEAMQQCRAQRALMALMYLDVDRFKPVNDTHGHAVGDALLRAFGGRLVHALRAGDMVARLGGDEFTIVMEGVRRPEDALGTAAKIVRAMQAPFDLDGVTVHISTSIGLTFYRDAELAPAQLLQRADQLLYEAKQAGRNTFRADPAFAAAPTAVPATWDAEAGAA